MARAILVLLIAAGLALLSWPQAIDAARWMGVAQLIAFRLALAIGALIAAVALVALGLASRRIRRTAGVLAVLLILFAGGQVAVLAVRGIGEPALPARGVNDLTVLSWNTHGAVSAAVIARAAISFHADVVALPETPAATANAVAARMTAAGQPMQAHTVRTDQVYGSHSTSLLIATSLGAYRVARVGAGDVPTLVATPSAGQNAPVLAAVHTVSPQPGQTSTWRADVAELTDRCTSANTVLAGDFNATLDHLWGLGTSKGTIGRCRDAALATGNAAVGTWPSSLPALLAAPIDHVLSTPNWQTAGFRVLTSLDGTGSDHRPILARLRPAD